jgi:hypothetical protein
VVLEISELLYPYLSEMLVDVSHAALQAHGIVNVALRREYSPSIIFISSKGGNDLYHV